MSSAAAQLHAWLVDEALPFWATAGVRTDSGCFHERLHFDGRPVAAPHRAMVQARQIFVFADAARRGHWPGGGALAQAALARLIHIHSERSNGMMAFAFSADPDGTIRSASKDAYTHAFILLGLAAVYRIEDDPLLLRYADEILEFIDRRLLDPHHGGLYDRWPIDNRVKRQNPIMHLVEALLFLEASAPGRGYIERAMRWINLCDTKMVRQDGFLPEFFAEDWTNLAEPPGLVIEPGHMFEWAWLVDLRNQLSQDSTDGLGDRFRSRAARSSFAPTGLVWDEIDAQDRPLSRNHRLWPHCEAIKAFIRPAANGDADSIAQIDRLSRLVLTQFVGHPFRAAWIDRIDEKGEWRSEDIPASSLYHLYLCGVELERIRKTTPTTHPITTETP